MSIKLGIGGTQLHGIGAGQVEIGIQRMTTVSEGREREGEGIKQSRTIRRRFRFRWNAGQSR